MDDLQRKSESGQSTPVETGWNRLIAISIVVALVGLAALFSDRLGADFWPLDSSRIGPNIIASFITWAIVFAGAALLYPPWRRALHRFLDRKFNLVHNRLDQHHEHILDLHEKVDLLHQKHDEHTKLMRAHIQSLKDQQNK